MGYYAHSYESDFLIMKKNFISLKAAIGETFSYNGNWWDKLSIKDVLSECGFCCEFNHEGDVESFWYEEQKFYSSDIKTLFDTIAPFVVEGSHISFIGEDDCLWAYYFDGATCKEYDAVVVYPGMPTGGPKKL